MIMIAWLQIVKNGAGEEVAKARMRTSSYDIRRGRSMILYVTRVAHLDLSPKKIQNLLTV
jgi:hypothetical protein